MYDWELKKYLEQRNYNLNHKDYLYVCKTCPQLNHIKYEPFDNIFKAWSSDGEYFEFKVYYDKNLELRNDTLSAKCSLCRGSEGESMI